MTLAVYGKWRKGIKQALAVSREEWKSMKV
jgi:hypothetical protein